MRAVPLYGPYFPSASFPVCCGRSALPFGIGKVGRLLKEALEPGFQSDLSM